MGQGLSRRLASQRLCFLSRPCSKAQDHGISSPKQPRPQQASLPELLPRCGSWAPEAHKDSSLADGRCGSVEGLHRTGGDLYPAGNCLRGSGWNRSKLRWGYLLWSGCRDWGFLTLGCHCGAFPGESGVKNRVPGPGTSDSAVVPEGSACHPEKAETTATEPPAWAAARAGTVVRSRACGWGVVSTPATRESRTQQEREIKAGECFQR